MMRSQRPRSVGRQTYQRTNNGGERRRDSRCLLAAAGEPPMAYRLKMALLLLAWGIQFCSPLCATIWVLWKWPLCRSARLKSRQKQEREKEWQRTKSGGSLLTRQMSRRRSWASIRHLPRGLPESNPDVLGNSPDHCFLLHADGAGTKSRLPHPFSQAWGPRHIRRDRSRLPGDECGRPDMCGGVRALRALEHYREKWQANPRRGAPGHHQRLSNLAEKFREYGIEIYSCGGETADIGDLVRTIVVDSVLRLHGKEDFID